MIKKILVANRGEIACRIIKTAKNLGLETVAIYSDPDKNALHVQMADSAYCVGSAASKNSYLRSEKIVEIALKAQVNAIHPGYGFLSENAFFAEQCRQAGIIFIGPTPEAIRAMGSKSIAKKIMEKAGIPLLSGYHGDNQNAEFLLTQTKKIGFPVMLKAAAGGGGKGMRIVEQENTFMAALQSAKREAQSSFNNDEILIEKYINNPRHIEIQIFADTHGNFVHLFERDCSIQRRHQKIIEETPATNLLEKTRSKMAKIAIEAAKAINYVNAGTIEFLMDQKQNFYFMEMNTRLQVEHPITEMITGLDLVEWQIRIAEGEPLPLSQKQITAHGHAIEVRIYAEDPFNNFLPAAGKITYLQTPQPNRNIRIDSGIKDGDDITPYYDPMLTKLIVWEKNRSLAIQKILQALKNYYVVGVKTNIEYLQKIINTPAFTAANITTHFVQDNEKILFEKPAAIDDFILISACLYQLIKQNKSGAAKNDYSPWQKNDCWRLNLVNQQQLIFLSHNEKIICDVHSLNNHYEIIFNNKSYLCSGKLSKQNLLIQFNDTQVNAKVIRENSNLHIFYDGQHQLLQIFDPLLDYEHNEESKHSLDAPMPGTIIAIFAKPGAEVDRGEKVMILEAMKMEHTIQAPTKGIIKAIHYAVGDIVNEGAELVSFETEK